MRQNGPSASAPHRMADKRSDRLRSGTIECDMQRLMRDARLAPLDTRTKLPGAANHRTAPSRRQD